MPAVRVAAHEHGAQDGRSAAGTSVDVGDAGPADASRPWRWRERWCRQRDRWLASPAFQRWAGAFPLTRAIARRRARALFDLVAGFAYSQVLLACVRLGLFELLQARERTLGEIATHAGIDRDAASRLVKAAVALRLLEPRGRWARSGEARYGLGPLGAPLAGQAGLRAMIEHHEAFYADLADPVALLRGRAGPTRLAAYWPYADNAEPSRLDGPQVERYSTLMSASQSLVAEEILQTGVLQRHRVVLDVGGGDGTFLEAALRRVPHLQGIVFDLPAVAARAEQRASGQAHAARLHAVGGDFLRDALPGGADLITLVRVLHDHDDESVRIVLAAARAALPPGGAVLVAEPMAGAPGAETVGDAYFGLYLLAMGRGRARSPDALEALLREAGFDRVRLLANPIPLQTNVLVARVSSAQTRGRSAVRTPTGGLS